MMYPLLHSVAHLHTSNHRSIRSLEPHPNLVQLVGVCNSPDPSIVYEVRQNQVWTSPGEILIQFFSSGVRRVTC